jgi:SAM-dependent methyltransferase
MHQRIGAAPAMIDDRELVNPPRSCLGCGEKSLQRIRGYRTKSARGRALFGRSALSRCPACHLVQVDPLPQAEALNAYYTHDYRTGGLYGSDTNNATTFPRDNLFYLNRGESIAELVVQDLVHEPREILDVGAGFGHVLHAFGQRFPEARRLAIEFSDVCVEHLRDIGAEAVAEPMEQVMPRLDRQFDVIVLSHVFEHLLDPKHALQILVSRLAPDGILYIEVPNISGDALMRYLDHQWAPRYDEPHVTFFDQESLADMLKRHGLQVIRCQTAGPLYEEVSRMRFSLPPFRQTVLRMIPKPVFQFLRASVATKAIRVQDREEEFFEYGGRRLWVRSVSRRV